MKLRHLVALALLGAATILAPVARAQTIDRSQCIQYGGNAICWAPVIGRWKYNVCGQIGAFGAWHAAQCQAQGGTWSGGTCQNLPPAEVRRPATEGDIVPLAKDEFANYHAPLCDGPNATGYNWGVSIFSTLCSTAGPGAIYYKGHEQHNNTDFFTVSGKKTSGGLCTTDVSLNFSASRDRPVECPSHNDNSFIWTSGSTPSLCSLGFRYPVNTRQSCKPDCPTTPQVGNPIDPITGVKRQVEVDYEASGPQPLRFERVYHSRVYVLRGHWRHNYSAQVEYQTFGTHPVVFAHRADGRSISFRLNVSGQFVPNADIRDKLTKLTDAGGNLTGWEYLEAEPQTLETYDADGRLLSIRLRSGLTQALEYSTASTPPAIAAEPGLLIRVTDHFGRELNFTYDAIGRLKTMQDPAGQTYAYAHSSNRMLTGVTYPDGKSRTYVYGENGSPAHLLTGIVDENKSRFATYSYDAYYMAVGSQHTGAFRAGVSYSGWPNSIVVRDGMNTTRTYTYQMLNGVYVNTGVTQPAGSGTGTATRTLTYNSNGNVVTSRKDFNGNRTDYSYDFTRHLETSRTEGLNASGGTTPATRIVETQWHATFRFPTLITEKNASGTALRATAISHDTNGNVLTRTVTDVPSSQSRTMTYTYDANGQVLTADGPRTDVSDVTTYTYYADSATCLGSAPLGCRGQVNTVTNAAGHVTEVTEYNAHGQPLTVVDPNGVTTTLVYDARRRLTSRTASGETTSYEYDDAGQLKKVTLPDGSHLAYTYDAAHRLKEIADNAGNRIVYTLDHMDNRTKEEVFDPGSTLRRTLSRTFDSLSRLRLEIQP